MNHGGDYGCTGGGRAMLSTSKKRNPILLKYYKAVKQWLSIKNKLITKYPLPEYIDGNLIKYKLYSSIHKSLCK